MNTVTDTLVWPDWNAKEDLKRLREAVPLTHCITNVVVTNFSANVLLAIGASPAMAIASEESGGFAKIAGGVLINIGTITRIDKESMLIAAAAAQEAGTPWVLDPVAAGASEIRTNTIRELLPFKPSVIRGNASEIIAVSGAAGNVKGPDSTESSGTALPYAVELALKTGSVVAVSGEVDYVTDGKKIIAVPGGHVIMTKTTGTGCALGGVMAAFLAVTGPLRAAAAASLVYAETGKRAAQAVRGSGSFAVKFLDELSLIGKEY
ncbi:MAG: hydroxyethylthiazole kinase [Treponema sp.]|jgi:hydroxyethylthiazole kinase|nr:hydroxyethylthiazole kinase [Treponema sp.]